MSNNSAAWKKHYKARDGPASTSPVPIKVKKRRMSSFGCLSSPYTRRSSFLSKAMLENESLQCYKLHSHSSFYSAGDSKHENLPAFSISLSESQGFIWNQDLFASSYQQSEAGVDKLLSMSDGSFLDDEDTINPIVDVIDVILSPNDYHSDEEANVDMLKTDNTNKGERIQEVGTDQYGGCKSLNLHSFNASNNTLKNEREVEIGIKINSINNLNAAEYKDSNIYVSNL
ncbi:Protein UGX2 [Pichia kudriavzevii]|uniref:Protein UGX2 n=1 Tax=Pichia kudriavzevii TaxID=4909 RepID=A0A1V2LI26_PICKU|nr:Protein UGX2 [Pichia kudriavzevii]